MVFIRKKTFNGKTAFYLEYSFRLPNEKVKKISRYLSKIDLKNKDRIISESTSFFQKIEEDILTKYFIDYYKKDYIFSEDVIKELENIKIRYKELIKKLTKKQFEDVLDRFTVNFTYESNAIEGNSLTLKDVNIIIHENTSIKGKDLREIYETINTRKVVELMFQNKFKINEKNIVKIHSLLIKNTGIQEGYKTFPNFLLMRETKTTPPENVKEEMSKLISWYESEPKLHPLMKAALFHARFEQIHPFEDGNGRVGRMLINIILLNNNYPPLIVRKTQRIQYFNALEAYDQSHADKIKRFIIEKYKATYKNFFEVYVKYLKQ